MSRNEAERLLEMRKCPVSSKIRVCGAWCEWALPVYSFHGNVKYCKSYDCELLAIFERIIRAFLNA